MKASKMLWNSFNMEGLKSKKTYELLENASIIYSNFNDKKIYSYFPLGQLVLNKVESVARNVLNDYEIQEIYLPSFQPHDIWKTSGRDKDFDNRMIFLRDYPKSGDKYVLSPTNEEVATVMAKSLVASHKQLPINFYQISDKFRNDPGTKHGIVRTNIFRMLEAYSFNLDRKCLDNSAELFKEAFMKIFEKLELNVKPIEKRKDYTTFISSSDEGDTNVASCNCGVQAYYPKMKEVCKDCNQKFTIDRGIELGCIMKEGSRYSEKFNANYLNEKSEKKPINLGTYAIGISRVIHSIADQNKDELGLRWPEAATPIEFCVIPVDSTDEKQMKYSTDVYNKVKLHHSVILEDREGNLGRKTKFYDSLGVPKKLIVGEREISNKTITIRERNKKEESIPIEGLELIL